MLPWPSISDPSNQPTSQPQHQSQPPHLKTQNHFHRPARLCSLCFVSARVATGGPCGSRPACSAAKASWASLRSRPSASHLAQHNQRPLRRPASHAQKAVGSGSCLRASHAEKGEQQKEMGLPVGFFLQFFHGSVFAVFLVGGVEGKLRSCRSAMVLLGGFNGKPKKKHAGLSPLFFGTASLFCGIEGTRFGNFRGSPKSRHVRVFLYVRLFELGCSLFPL